MNRFRIQLFAILALCGIFSACDSVAEFIFENDVAAAFRPLALKPAGCNSDLKCLTGTCRVLDFSLISTTGNKIIPGYTLSHADGIVEPGKNFTADHFQFSGAVLFQLDEQGNDLKCATSADCLGGFQCLLPSEAGLATYYYLPQRICLKPTSVSVENAPSFTHFREKTLPDNALATTLNANGYAIAMAIDNSGNLDGSLNTGIPDESVATDPQQYRKMAIDDLISEIFHPLRSQLANSIQLAFLFMNGTGESGVYDASETFFTKESKVGEFLNTAFPTPSGNAPVFETILAALQKIAAAEPSYARMTVAFTSSNSSHSTEDAFTQLRNFQQSSNAGAVHIVQLSSDNLPSPPDPRYIEIADQSCASYFYFSNPAQLQNVMQNIGTNIESRWSLPINIKEDLPKGKWFRLAMNMKIHLGDQTLSYDAHKIQEYNQTIDNRFMIYEF